MNCDPPTFDQTGLLSAHRWLSMWEFAFGEVAPESLATEFEKAKVARACDDLQLRAGALKIQSTLAQIDRCRFELNYDDLTYGKLHRLCEGLRERLEDDLQAIKFLYIPPHRAALYENPLSGIEDVANEFPSTRDDLAESSECHSLGRFTASVFHLMRALEPCLGAISRELEVDKHSPTWNAYLAAFPKAILAKFPAKDAADGAMREFYDGITAHLSAIKNVWRNPTMHKIAATYNERQALDVRQSVHGFMRHLATKLKE